ncbi:MAG: Ig-like domain-containing protein, partial [Longimicrobiales bacterium]
MLAAAGCGEGTTEIQPPAAPSASRLALATPPSVTSRSRVALAVQPVVQLQNAAGGNVQQAAVSVSVRITGGGVLAGPTTLATNNSGAAAFAGLSISGLAGPQTLSFSAPGLGEVAATVSLLAGLPARIVANSDTALVAIAGTAVFARPSVRVTDADGNAVSDVRVTFAAANGGTVTGAEQITDANGIATVGGWQLGNTTGVHSLTATATG